MDRPYLSSCHIILSNLCVFAFVERHCAVSGVSYNSESCCSQTSDRPGDVCVCVFPVARWDMECAGSPK